MKVAMVFILLASMLGHAVSSTCKSRCEEIFGKGDPSCDRVCEGVEETPRRVSKSRTAQQEAEARAAFEAGASHAAASRAAKAVKPAASAASAGLTK